MQIKWYRPRRLAGGLAALFFAGSVFAGGVESFNEGLKAYRAKDYQQAVTHFEEARKQGLKKVAVYFNLGSSYYRLGQYDKAVPMFQRVTRYREMADIGYFNLGLVARQQNQNELAKTHFKQSIALSKNQKLIYLAQQNISEIDNRVGVWSSSVGVDMGYDDNISNTALGVAMGGDSYVTLRAHASAMLKGSRKKGWSAYGNFYNRSYSNLTTYSLGSFTGGARRYMPLLGHTGELDGSYKILTLGGGAYENIAGLGVSMRTKSQSSTYYRYRYRFDSISTDPLYDYLQGTRQRLQFERHSRLNERANLQLIYRFEMNDRQNSASASYSNIRHGVRAVYNVNSNDKVRWRSQIRYRYSDYTPVAAQNREDSMLQISVQRRQKLKDGLEWSAMLSSTRNDSTDAAYTYSSNVVQAGIRKRF